MDIGKHERIVVTGMGAVTPLGLTVAESIDSIIAGHDGIVSISDTVLKDYPQLRVSVAALVENFNLQNNPHLAERISVKDERKLHRSSQFALWAGNEALKQAELLDDQGKINNRIVNPERVGVRIGTGVGGANMVAETRVRIDEGKRISPSFILQVLPERVATTTSMIFGAKGPVTEVTSACATGNANIIDAVRLLRLGEVDVVIAGGSEAQLTAEGIALFDGTTALDSTVDPREASRPFHMDSNGFVMGEGAGVLVLETAEHAKRRGAVILAELVGYAETADAYHDTAPSGEGAESALRRALGDYALRGNIYINAHATGTAGDAVELTSIGKVLSPEQVVGISSTKGATGHMLGAAGAFESIVSIEALRRGMIPPSLKLNTPIPETEPWRMSELKATPAEIEVVINNSFGFGGLNAVTVYARANN